jgi:hypothetical protein
MRSAAMKEGAKDLILSIPFELLPWLYNFSG